MKPANTTLLVATGNEGKRKEFETLLTPLLEPGWAVLDRKSLEVELADIVEDADTFAGNAIKKALESARQTGLCALGDDSGLVVEALGGRPGVRSARYAGPQATDEANNRRLIEELSDKPGKEHKAYFVSALCLVLLNNTFGQRLLARRGMKFEELVSVGEDELFELPEGKLVRLENEGLIYFEGKVEGRIIEQARGEGGFGYDPHFLVEAWGKTMAEVPRNKKNSISHRARATQKLVEYFSP